MPSLFENARILTDSLRLTQPPVAICLADAVDPAIPLWSGHSPAGCRFWQEAGARVFATVAGDHAFCSIGQYTHNLEMQPAAMRDLQAALQVFGALSYVREEDVRQIPVLASKPRYVLYGPLAEIPLAPDVVLLFVRADQTLLLSEASQQLENGMPPAMGRPACALIPQTVNSGRSALSLGCCGARAYLDVLTENVALYAIPGAALAAFTERIAALAHANSVLGRLHEIRRRDIESGKSPTMEESWAALEPA